MKIFESISSFPLNNAIIKLKLISFLMNSKSLFPSLIMCEMRANLTKVSILLKISQIFDNFESKKNSKDFEINFDLISFDFI